MFRSAYLRLTGWYLALILLLSVCFSITLYQVSVDELDRGLHRQAVVLDESPIFGQIGFQEPNFDQIRQDQVSESKNHIIWNLVYFNLSVLFLGGLASYFLARRTLQPIEESLESQNRFTADASHELRTPLTAMKSEIEVALRDKELSLAESKDLLKSNLEEVERLSLLSSSLLKLAGQTNRLDPASLQGCLLSEIIDKAIDAAKAKERKAVIIKEIQDGSLKADGWSLTELLTILIDNAIKYSPKEAEITIKAHTDHRFAYISVADKGMGIKALDLPHIFDRFYRADPSRSKDRVEGYGLGLSIAQKIADLHHGRIEVTSELGRGSTFKVILPVAPSKIQLT